MCINTFSVCSGHKKEKWIHCSSMVYFTTWMMREKAQDCTWSQRYAWPLKREHISTTTHPVVCHSVSKIMPEKRKVSRNMRFCHKHTLFTGINKPRNQQELLWSSPLLVACSSSWQESFPLAKGFLKCEKNSHISIFCKILSVTCQDIKKKQTQTWILKSA